MKNIASIQTPTTVTETSPTAPKFWQVVALRVATGADSTPDDLTIEECRVAVRILTVQALTVAAIAAFFAIRAITIIATHGPHRPAPTPAHRTPRPARGRSRSFVPTLDSGSGCGRAEGRRVHEPRPE